MAEEHAHEEGKGGGHGHAKHHGGHGGGDHEEHEGAPEWLISFADNVALMMGFFVILMAMNLGPKGTSASKGDDTEGSGQTPEMLDWAIGVREAFHNPVSPDNPRDAMLWKRKIERQAEDAHIKAPRGKELDVTNIRQGPYKSSGGLVTFETKSAALDDAGRAAIREIVAHRRGLSNIIEVIGNVSKAEGLDLADHGMDLSFQRARTVANALVEAGVDRDCIQIKAMANTDPAAVKAYGEHAQRQNQRVEIVETTRTSNPEGSHDEPDAQAPESQSPGAQSSPAPAQPQGHGGG